MNIVIPSPAHLVWVHVVVHVAVEAEADVGAMEVVLAVRHGWVQFRVTVPHRAARPDTHTVPRHVVDDHVRIHPGAERGTAPDNFCVRREGWRGGGGGMGR
jgi:hypothetical protein